MGVGPGQFYKMKFKRHLLLRRVLCKDRFEHATLSVLIPYFARSGVIASLSDVACMVGLSMRPVSIISSVLVFTTATAAGADDKTWKERTTIDLHAIHDIILEDHPGPVDPVNPGFKVWLERGLSAALRAAPAVESQADYFRVVGGYTAGFRDNHLAVEPHDLSYDWPGFLTALRGNKVLLTAKDSTISVPVGSEITSCDGVSSETLMKRSVYSYRSNADVPQTKELEAPRLFTVVQGDEQAPRACRFDVGGRDIDVKLVYKPVTRKDMFAWIDKASGTVTPPQQAREIGRVWLISIPTFDWFDADAARMEAFIDHLQELCASLHAAQIVVLDVRGNGGGNSEWGERVVAALFGDDNERKVKASFDDTVDWRVSSDNERELRRNVEREESSGLNSAEASMIADGVATALRHHQVYFRQAAPATYRVPEGGQPSPFTGKVYLLTDHSCASACLDFADSLLKFRGVEHVGLPTNADAIYIDIAHVPLPSGTAHLRYGLKVYRNRLRGNNEWLEPTVRWTGGSMTDQSIATWVSALSRP